MTDEELFQFIKSGDRDAEEKLFENFYPTIRSVIRKHNEEATKNKDHPDVVYREPSPLLIICGNAPMAYTTQAGVRVIPAGCIKD